LVAAIAGPIITLTVARRQFSATVISANRQKRIETLRDTLAELIALLHWS
jgi:glycerol-3-phosphate dehydrogenase